MKTRQDHGEFFDRKEKCAITVCSLLSMSTMYPEQRVVVHAFFDTLLRHFPGTRVIEILAPGAPGEARVVYSTVDSSPLASRLPTHSTDDTVSDDDVLLLNDAGARYWLCVYSISDIAAQPRFERRRDEEHEVRDIISLLDHARTGRKLLKKISKFLSAPKTQFTASRRHSVPPSSRADTALDHRIKELRAILDDTFHGTSVFWRYGSSRPFIENVLTFIRATDTSVRLVLSGKQAVWVRRNWQPTADFPELITPDDALHALETPISLEGGAVLLTSFQTGYVGYSALNDPADSPMRVTSDSPHRTLRLLSWLIDRAIATAEGASRTERHFFYIPIHVQGIPWLCLANAWVGASEQGWDYFFTLYSAVASTIAAKLRAGVKELYLREINRPIELYLRDEHRLARAPLVDQINLAWRDLHRFFPYPTLTLAAAKSDTRSSHRLPSLGDFCVEWHERSPAPFRLPYELVDLAQVAAACEEHITQVSRDIKWQTEALRDELDLLIPHHIKQVLQRTVIGPVSQARDVGPTPERERLLSRALEAATDCHDNLKHWLFVAREVRGVPDSDRRRLRIGAQIRDDLTPAACGISHIADPLPPLSVRYVPALEDVELPISTDVFRIVLNILLTNALNAMDRYNVSPDLRKIEILFDPAPPDDRSAVTISVWNSGTFIDADLRSKAGREVLKRDGMTEQQAPHGGLGLFILEKLLRLCNAHRLPCDRHFDFETHWDNDPARRWAKIHFILPVARLSHG